MGNFKGIEEQLKDVVPMTREFIDKKRDYPFASTFGRLYEVGDVMLLCLICLPLDEGTKSPMAGLKVIHFSDKEIDEFHKNYTKHPTESDRYIKRKERDVYVENPATKYKGIEDQLIDGAPMTREFIDEKNERTQPFKSTFGRPYEVGDVWLHCLVAGCIDYKNQFSFYDGVKVPMVDISICHFSHKEIYDFYKKYKKHPTEPNRYISKDL